MAPARAAASPARIHLAYPRHTVCARVLRRQCLRHRKRLRLHGSRHDGDAGGDSVGCAGCFYSVPRRAVTRPFCGLSCFPSLAGRLAAYTPALRWAGAAALTAGAILLACQGWGLGAFEWVMGTGGQRVSGAVVSITLTLAIAVVAWESASSAIQRFTETGARGILGARRRTLLPLLQKTLFAFLTVMVVLITLSEIGINIAPLLAGAGVAGLAIGFGAQRLVQDVITGFFMLVEDAVAVGDIVSVGNASGVVEDMSVRAPAARRCRHAAHSAFQCSVNCVQYDKEFFLLCA